ncbi:hypothetical protein PROPEN_04067 [Proteus penneri ATCC 35198]|nr:hypothetical protein PROPEN_04067 [Proteus penneri ATCC 35198]
MIANPEYREKFKQCLIAAGIHNPGYFSVPAFLQAYTLQGQQWVGELKTYLADNRRWVKEQCERYFPDWVVTQSHGTYMLWVNYQKNAVNRRTTKTLVCFISRSGNELGAWFWCGWGWFFPH